MVMDNIICFDVDGTLVQPFTANLLPLTADWFAAWRQTPDDQRPRIAITTNQGGPALRQWMIVDGWGQPDNLPSVGPVIERLQAIREVLVGGEKKNTPVPIFAATAYQTKSGTWAPVQITVIDTLACIFAKPETGWRKPRAGMLDMVARWHGGPVSYLVGDSNDDEGAAQEGQAQFIHREVFFSPGGVGYKMLRSRINRQKRN